ncbi:MAG: hypothetical protein SVX38_11675 [Chloroflexota bacterium]|nr:hypothetical protein [Chloroflexota bacterium]
MSFANRHRLSFQVLLTGVLGILVISLVAIYLPFGIDWHEAFRPASLAMMSGKSPYIVKKFYAAPWGLLPLIPLALLPENIGRGVLFFLNIVSLIFVAHRFEAKPLAIVVFLLSPPVLHGLLNANIDWLAMLGFVLPPQIGLLFVLIKPQVGIGLAVFWLITAWQEGGYRRVVRVFGPLILTTTISFVLFGIWPIRFLVITDYSNSFNASFWPSSIPIGLALLVTSVRKNEARYAIPSSPCFSPHVVFHSYAGTLAALLPATAEITAAVIGLWILVSIRAFGGAL